MFINDTVTGLNPHYVAARAPERAEIARPLLDAALAPLLAVET